ncbi:MmgE/PrpD family protein [Xylophilus sp.]|uniref:MmgE/PrpD family protein n=1 Tax=Xylophilus sp. TaxID=2653893 RepID=UPI0013BC664A|nr:MmgE/PrpD family protein [Xylophilus sp.]KAF1048727.1 MAG: hypothetical protein GAK38_01171 [Xylophilus sp.]
MTTPATAPLARRLGAYAAEAAALPLPAPVLDAARQCLVDWLAVVVGARDSDDARVLAATAAQWRSQGPSPLFTGGTAAAGVAAWVNAGLSHVLDFDDTHIPSILHGSGPLWAALLAVGAEHGVAERRLLAAFSAGLQAGARVGASDAGGINLGVRLTQSGWHATPILGRLAVAAAVPGALGLDGGQAAHTIAIAATHASGFGASSGTLAKPLHIAHAAFDGIASAQAASHGGQGAPGILDGEGGLFQILLQDRGLVVAPRDPAEGPHELLRNSCKPYAACQLIHASLDAARQAAAAGIAPGAVRAARAFVHPLAARIAAVAKPRTTAEGRFSLAHSIALGLHSYAAGADDFEPPRLADPRLAALASRVSVVADAGAERTSARLELVLDDGRVHVEHVAAAFGSPERPMDWPALQAKFTALAAPRLGDAAAGEVFALARRFGEQPGDLARLHALAVIR